MKHLTDKFFGFFSHSFPAFLLNLLILSVMEAFSSKLSTLFGLFKWRKIKKTSSRLAMARRAEISSSPVWKTATEGAI